ncbi:hypothetical protein B0H13DRAFT_1571840, partial [Mycena leptocephala]
WDHLDRKVRAWRPLPSSEDELWRALQEWAAIDEGYITRLYKSMPRRVQAIHDANG